MENKTFGLASFAILIEAIITYFNKFFVQENFCWQMLLSIALGIVIAVAYELDLHAHFNLNSQIPYVGCMLTGVLLSRGSNYLKHNKMFHSKYIKSLLQNGTFHKHSFL